jgi:SAM-dependent methyltransferase
MGFYDQEELLVRLRPFLEKEHPCTICGGKKLSVWAAKGYLEAKRCVDCGMISVNPHLSEEGIKEFYSSYFKFRQDDITKKQLRDITYLIDRDWVSLFVKGGRVLDVGCSGGFFLSKFSPEKWERFGVEIADDAAEYAKKMFNIPVFVGDIVKQEFDHLFDLVMLRGVIEHFSDPVSVLKKCCQLLKPGGSLFITATPAGDSFAFNVYREKWTLFTPFEHIHFFSVKLLTRILSCYDMALVSHHYQYEETPYASPEVDFEKIQEDIVIVKEGNRKKISSSVPFPGSMITALWRKKT